MDLTDDQWRLIQPLLPQHPSRPGRPWQDDRAVLDAILWLMRTASPWRRLPPQYLSYKTCHRRCLQWKRSGVLRKIILTLYYDLRDRGGLDLACFSSDGDYVFPKSGAPAWICLAGVDPEGSWAVLHRLHLHHPTAQSPLSPSPLPFLINHDQPPHL